MDFFVERILSDLKSTITALVYLARAQGFRAGVKPYTLSPELVDENFPPTKRAVFIDFNEKTVTWPLNESNAEFLDSFPQYSN